MTKKITGINGLEIDSIPSGVVVSWYGDKVNVPSGWAICDGTNGTPDLRDRFIVGAGNSYSLKATGGANTVSLTADQNGAHNHDGNLNISTDSHNQSYTIGYGNLAHLQNINISSGGSGEYSLRGITSISATTASSGKGAAHENRPPYYALYFIMKL